MNGQNTTIVYCFLSNTLLCQQGQSFRTKTATTLNNKFSLGFFSVCTGTLKPFWYCGCWNIILCSTHASASICNLWGLTGSFMFSSLAAGTWRAELPSWAENQCKVKSTVDSLSWRNPYLPHRDSLLHLLSFVCCHPTLYFHITSHTHANMRQHHWLTSHYYF